MYEKAIMVKEDENPFWEEDLVGILRGTGYTTSLTGECLTNRRISGMFTGRGLWLNPQYDWEIVLDEYSDLILVPTEKHLED